MHIVLLCISYYKLEYFKNTSNKISKNILIYYNERVHKELYFSETSETLSQSKNIPSI